MATTFVFYSWQSDLPNATNRSFILEALERAAKSIRNDDSLAIDPVIDRDTTGVPGSPNIAATIFEKIDRAEVVVFDVSLVSMSDGGRPAPNANVLIELGWAMKSRSWERIVLVMNTAYGPPEHLPFDLRQHRVIPYGMPAAQTERAPERNRLSAILETALRAALQRTAQTAGTVIAPPSLADLSIQAIESGANDRASRVRRFMQSVVEMLNELAPDLAAGEFRYETLKRALDETIPTVADYARVAERAAASADEPAIRELYRGLEGIAAGCYLPARFGGTHWTHQHDYYRFLTHELLVVLVSLLIKDEQWQILRDMLRRGLFVENPLDGSGPGVQPYTYMSQSIPTMASESKRTERASIHADVIKDRQTSGPLAELVGLRAFMDADYFLFLRSVLKLEQENVEPWHVEWWPVSVLWMDTAPRYLYDAVSAEYGSALAHWLDLTGQDVLRARLAKRAHLAHSMLPMQWRYGRTIGGFDPNTIGTK